MTWATEDFTAVVRPQIAAARVQMREHGHDPREPLTFVYGGESLYVTAGQLALWSDEYAAEQLLERYIDPWRGVGVVSE